MAASMVHLAITEVIAKSIKVKDINRLRIGSILPDGAIGGNSHLRKKFEDGFKTFDIETFRETFGDKMREDDLYLGYYLHLVQDIIYRKFIYEIYGWNPYIEGNVDRLHHDYEILNSYVARKFGLTPESIAPIDLNGEPLEQLAQFDVNELVERVRGQFIPVEDDGIFFFTREMVDEYIARAVKESLEEILRFLENKECLKCSENKWRVGTQR